LGNLHIQVLFVSPENVDRVREFALELGCLVARVRDATEKDLEKLKARNDPLAGAIARTLEKGYKILVILCDSEEKAKKIEELQNSLESYK